MVLAITSAHYHHSALSFHPVGAARVTDVGHMALVGLGATFLPETAVSSRETVSWMPTAAV